MRRAGDGCSREAYWNARWNGAAGEARADRSHRKPRVNENFRKHGAEVFFKKKIYFFFFFEAFFLPFFMAFFFFAIRITSSFLLA
jgi:hypothetical protein